MRAGVAVLRREAAGEQVWNKARLGDSFRARAEVFSLTRPGSFSARDTVTTERKAASPIEDLFLALEDQRSLFESSARTRRVTAWQGIEERSNVSEALSCLRPAVKLAPH